MTYKTPMEQIREQCENAPVIIKGDDFKISKAYECSASLTRIMDIMDSMPDTIPPAAPAKPLEAANPPTDHSAYEAPAEAAPPPTGCLGDACIHYGVPPIATPCFTCVDGDKAVVKDGASTTSYLHPLFEMLERTGLPPVESEMHDIMACCAKIEEGLREDEPSQPIDYQAENAKRTSRELQDALHVAPQPAMDWQDTGVALIAAERKRQIEEEGWTHAGDNDHDDNDLAKAGACYAAGQSFVHFAMDDDSFKHDSIEWPWGLEWYKPEGGRVRELTKAGALIAAEIDRLNRNKQAGTGAKGGTE